MTIVRPQITSREYRCPACQARAHQYVVRLAGFRALVECPTCEHRHIVRLTDRLGGESR